GAVPQVEAQKRLRLDLAWELMAKIFERVDQIFAACPVVLLAGPVGGIGIDPESFPPAGLGLLFEGLFDNSLSAFGVVAVRHGNAPVRHGAVRIEGGGLAKGALRLEIPEAV